MVNSQMDNPFKIGDLVHIPTGVVLYDMVNGWGGPAPAKVSERPSVGLIMKKDGTGLYRVAIGQVEYLITKEDMSLITRKAVR